MNAPDGADGLIDALRRERPWAAQLAELASPAAHIEPALLRRLRQQLLPAADAGAEADLWFSPLVSAHEPGACSLHDEVVVRLRERIAADAERCGRAIGIIREVHLGLPEALRVEEALTALALQGEQPLEPAVEACLQPALRALGGSDAAHALEVARWALQAAPRLAPPLRKAAAMQALLVASALRVEAAGWSAGMPLEHVSADQLAWLLPTDSAAGAKVRLAVSLTRQGVGFSAPVETSASTIELPRTQPLLLSLRWPLNGAWNTLLAPVNVGAEVVLEGAPQQVELTTLAGDRYRLSAAATAANGSDRPAADADADGVGESPPAALALLSIERSSDGFGFGFTSARARSELRVSVRPEMAAALLTQLADAAPRGADMAGAASSLLVPAAVHEALHDAAGSLLLHLDPAAAELPWELLLWDRKDVQDARPRAVRHGMTRQLSSGPAFRQAQQNHERTALLIGNPSVDRSGVTTRASAASSRQVFGPLPMAMRECEAVARRLRPAGFDVETLVGPSIEGPAVLVALLARGWRILHIAGHGVSYARDDLRIERIGVMLSDDFMLTVDELRQMRTTPALVFLNCCHVGTIGREGAVMGDPGRFAATIAQELLAIGVSCVVVAARPVNDELALRFSEVLYDRLMQNASFSVAVLAARQALWAQDPDDLTWGAFHAYGDPEHRLGGRTAAAAADAEAAERERSLVRTAVQFLRGSEVVGTGVFVAPDRVLTVVSVLPQALPDPSIDGSDAAMLQLQFDGQSLSGRVMVRDTASPLCLVSLDNPPPMATVLKPRTEAAQPAAHWQSVVWADGAAVTTEGVVDTVMLKLPSAGDQHPAADRMRVMTPLAEARAMQWAGSPLVVDGELAGIVEEGGGQTTPGGWRFVAIGQRSIGPFLRWALRPPEHEPWITLGATPPGDSVVMAEMARIERALQGVRLRPMPVRSTASGPMSEPSVRTLNAAHGAVRLLARSEWSGPMARDLLLLAYRAWADTRFPFLALSLPDDTEVLPPPLVDGRESWSTSNDLDALRHLLHEALDNDTDRTPDFRWLDGDVASLARQISPDDEDIASGLKAVTERGLGAASTLLAGWLRRAKPDQASRLLHGAALLALPSDETLDTLLAAAQAPLGQRAVCLNAMPVLIAQWLLDKAWYPGPPPTQIVVRDQQWPSADNADVLVAQVRAHLCKALGCSDDDARWLLAQATSPFALIFATRPLPEPALLARLRTALPAALLFFLAGNEPVDPKQAQALGLQVLPPWPDDAGMRLVSEYKQLRAHIDDRAATPAPHEQRRPAADRKSAASKAPKKASSPKRRATPKTPARK